MENKNFDIRIKNTVEFNFAVELANWLLNNDPESELLAHLVEEIRVYSEMCLETFHETTTDEEEAL